MPKMLTVDEEFEAIVADVAPEAKGIPYQEPIPGRPVPAEEPAEAVPAEAAPAPAEEKPAQEK
ncbi:hypothetical protein [Nocardiopsis alborubida]|uniref:Uncharacterized protein n=1 Tax=Nocardiopsis alborubida TaxID=146802 RepID=A0A7X6MIB6_9ACTN|nr:hypothetical protein [Nocardiopsis alborubida]NKZ01526.1 hypothetical protein [Nocardiopsis alborubida]